MTTDPRLTGALIPAENFAALRAALGLPPARYSGATIVGSGGGGGGGPPPKSQK